jgi:hypothetical protein
MSSALLIADSFTKALRVPQEWPAGKRRYEASDTPLPTGLPQRSRVDGGLGAAGIGIRARRYV